MPRVAAVQMQASVMDPDTSLARIDERAAEAAGEGAELVAFPELLVPGYPRYVPDPFPHTEEGEAQWSDIQGYFKAYVANSQVVPGPFTEALGGIASRHGVVMVVGVSERDPRRRAVLWNTAVVIDEQGRLVGRRRKVVAVMHERLYFERGGRDDVCVFDTSVGRLGVAICFENHNPGFRRALGLLGEELHLALWTGPAPRELAARGGRLEAHRELGVAHALDTGTFVVIASQVTPKELDEGRFASRWSHSGGSYMIDPLGRTLASAPDYEEAVLVADLDPSLIEAGRMIWNPVGEDARVDLFGGALSG